MEIRHIKEAKILDDFITNNPGESGAEFLLSSIWSGLLLSEGKEIKTLAVVENKDGQEEILVLVSLIKNTLGAGFYYWYAPRGPIFKSNLTDSKIKEAIDFLFLKIKQEDSRAVFVKIEPAQNLNNFWNLEKLIAAPAIQPKQTLILDLKKNEDDLLSEMHQKTRYNIRLAEKKLVKITYGTANDFSEFWRLMELTATRDSFRIHGKNHYLNLIKNNSDFLKLFFAEYEGKKIATAIVCFFGGKTTYLHGASDNEFRNIMAPYLLQWEIIKQAKAQNCKIYDFYGIDEKKWPGVTRFKLGFGGEIKNYPGVFEIVFKPVAYGLYNFLKLVRKILK